MSVLLMGNLLNSKSAHISKLFVKHSKYKHQQFRKWTVPSSKMVSRQFSDGKLDTSKQSFNEFVTEKQLEAKRSILVQVQSAKSYKELYSYCTQFGTVNKMLHYSAGSEPLHFILVEFSSEEDVKNTLSVATHVEDGHVIPVHSPFLWFKASARKSSPQLKNVPDLAIENGNIIYSNEKTNSLLQAASNISDQINILYKTIKLNDLGTRLRFLTARQVEVAVSGMFPSAVVLPFGSSVNGCGKMGCDLDLILNFNYGVKKETEGRLMYQCKESLGNERTQSQRHMETIGDLLQLFLPGCSQVRRILQARVPILKYYQQLTDVECDLSMYNGTAYYMSELLYLFGEIDDRVRPLIFTVRKWAQEVGLTNSSPGRWVTNFSLTLLVLAFLQNPDCGRPILPSLDMLIKLAGPDDCYISDDGVNCTFLRDASKLPKLDENADTLQSLLLKFFEYYSSFDFASKAISLNKGVAIPKPEHSALYIVNPLERSLNVSKNVSLEELERLKIEFRNAAWVLESQDKKTQNWGILSIFESSRNLKNKYYLPAKTSRLMEVKNLFEDNDGRSDTGENKEEVNRTEQSLNILNSVRGRKSKYVNIRRR